MNAILEYTLDGETKFESFEGTDKADILAQIAYWVELMDVTAVSTMFYQKEED